TALLEAETWSYDISRDHEALYKTESRVSQHASRAGACSLPPRNPHTGRIGRRLRSHLRALYPSSGERGRPQLSPGGEVAHAGTHPSPACWPMESPEREELGGALPAFDGQAPPHPPQGVSDASARPQTRVCGVSPFSRPALPPRRLFAEAPVLPCWRFEVYAAPTSVPGGDKIQ